MNGERFDYRLIIDMVPEGAKVLDLGCGDGELLRQLKDRKGIRGVGIETDERMVYSCVTKGVTVEHADIDDGLPDFADSFFDFVILNFSLPETRHPKDVINEALRVGKKVIVSFPNFAYYQVRLYLSFIGKTPTTEALPHHWDETPNLHYFTIKDFREFCARERIVIDSFSGFNDSGPVPFAHNLLAEKAMFVLRCQCP